MENKVIKGMILVGFMTLGMTQGFGANRNPADIDFKLNSSLDKLHGGFKKTEVKKDGSGFKGKIDLKSLWSSKPNKKNDLLEYFDAEDHPVGTFKVNRKGDKLEGTGNLKGEKFELKGEIKDGKAKVRISLKELIGGFKSNFIDSKDNVEMIFKLNEIK